MYVLHIAPFDPAGYPPLLNTIQVSRERSLDSVVVASSPTRWPRLLGEAELKAPERDLAGVSLQGYLARKAMSVARTHGNPSAIVSHDVRALGIGAMVASATRVPLVYHCHDFHTGESPRDKGLLLLERWAGALATEVWVPAPERRREALARGFRRVRVVRNYPALISQTPEPGRLRSWLRDNGSRSRGTGRIVTRHGRIGAGHCILETIEALAKLPEDTEFVVIGRGEMDYERACLARASDLGMEQRVFFHPFVPRDEMLELLVDGDAGSGLYAAGTINTDSPAPNKVYENLALGVPVVVWDRGSLADDVGGTAYGAVVPYGSIDGLSSAFGRLLYDDESRRASKEAARAAHLARFNYQTQLAGTLVDKTCCAGGASRR